MSNEVIAVDSIEQNFQVPMTKQDVVNQVRLIQEILKNVMIEGVHYGKPFPSSDEKSLLKPGAEMILSTFRIAVDPIIEDLSEGDKIAYRVTVRCTHQGSGNYLGSGIGSCSSYETKYRWRKAVNDQEWNDASPDKRRIKHSNYKGKAYTTKQVHQDPYDIENTILKMAKKRAMVDASLTITAASDIFHRDVEDLPDESKSMAKAGNKKQEPIDPPGS